MATYNGCSYLKDQLASVLSQSVSVDEVVISDDHSDDDTVSIAERLCDTTSVRSVISCNEKTLGFKANFHKAISLCTGDLIFLCDQDDIWEPQKVEHMVSFFDQHPDALAVFSCFSLIDGDGKLFERPSPPHTANGGLLAQEVEDNTAVKISLKTVLHANPCPGCTLAVRASLAKDFVKKSESLLPHDWELCLAAAAQNGLYFLNRPLIRYRIHSGNTLGFHGSETKRDAIARQKAQAARQLNRYRPDERRQLFFDSRANYLEKKSPFSCLRLWFCRDYYRYFSFRERVGDILFCLKA